MRLRFGADEYLAVAVQYLGEEYGFGIYAVVGDGGIRRSQLHIGNAFCQAAQSGGRIIVGVGQGGDTEILGVFHAQLGRNRLHKTSDCNDVHGVDDPVPDVGISLISAGIPVAEGFASYGIGGVVVDGPQSSASRIQSRSKGRDDLKGGSWLPGYVGGAV